MARSGPLTWRQQPLLRCRISLLAWGLTALLALFAAEAQSQSPLPALLQTLKLSVYPPDLKPPLFSSQTSTGQPVSLAALRGRVVLLNFWATWCGECRPEMPLLERLHRDFASQGLTVLGINTREAAEIVQRYARELQLTFPLVLDPQGEIAASYGVIGLPTTLLIGRDGRPIALAMGTRAWGNAAARTLIQTLLAEPKAPQEER